MMSLAGAWTLHDAQGAEVCAFSLPGDVHSALVAAGEIPDPLIGTNEADVQWVGEAEWEVRRTFTVGAANLADKWPVLDLEFVDTIAEVSINGAKVADLDSSFVRHRIDRQAEGG